MKMFYYDDCIANFEHGHKFNELLCYLIHHYTKYKESIYLNTIIAYSWYLLTSNEFDDSLEYTWEEYAKLWIQYLDIGRDNFINDPKFNFIAGYTLGIHFNYIMKYRSDRNEFMIYMQNAANQNQDPEIKLLANNFIEKQKSHKKISLNNDNCVFSLFSSNSWIDTYFRSIYLS